MTCHGSKPFLLINTTSGTWNISWVGAFVGVTEYKNRRGLHLHFQLYFTFCCYVRMTICWYFML
ncbi:hypothetical protein BDB01DRAFT_791194 [Pilobolus umbonatus]|nr:hypothetical protein BDB01DRAFT_791194 [Pilobolus umbonatus]